MLQTDVVFQDRYRIQCEVGRGSFGIVYAAEDLQTGQTVAVKVLLPWTRSNESLRHRLKARSQAHADAEEPSCGADPRSAKKFPAAICIS